MQKNYVEYVANQLQYYENSPVKYDTNITCDSFFKQDVVTALLSHEGSKKTIIVTLDNKSAKNWQECLPSSSILTNTVDLFNESNPTTIYIIQLPVYNNIYTSISNTKVIHRVIYDNSNLNYKGMIKSNVKWFFLFCECGGVVFHGTKVL